MIQPMGSRRDAASVIFNLPGYRVIDAVDLSAGGRRVKIQPVDLADGCPGVWVVSSRVHAWSVQRVRTSRTPAQSRWLLSAYDLTCRLGYDLTCRSRHGDHGMGSPPATRVRRSLSR